MNYENQKLYMLNYIHLFLYIVIFILSYYITYTYKFPFCLFTSITLGWSLYAFVTIGHDCMHENFSPYHNLNKFLSYFFLNGILTSREAWQEEHSSHHHDPGNPNDNMILEGTNIILNIVYLVKNQKKISISKQLFKLPLFISLIFLPFYCLPIIWLSMVLSFIYLSLSAHIIENNIRDWKGEKKPEEIALNIFPHSYFFCFLAGGLNIHGCHHKNPRWTRQELFEEAEKQGYKEINTIKEFITLMWNRNKNENIK